MEKLTKRDFTPQLLGRLGRGWRVVSSSPCETVSSFLQSIKVRFTCEEVISGLDSRYDDPD